MAFIELGKIDKNIIPIVIASIFCFLNRLLNQYEDTRLFKNTILTNIFISFSDIFMIIPYIIFVIRSNKIERNNSKSNIERINAEDNKFEYIFEEINIEDNVKYREYYIIAIGVIFFANYIMFVYTFQLKSNTWLTYILFTSIFYYFFFKAKLFKHHYLSIVMILLIGFIIDIVQKNFQNDFVENLWPIILSILRVILLSLDYVLIKYTMEKKYVSQYEIGVLNGLINLILFLIFAVLDYHFFKIYEYNDFFNNFNGKEVLVILGLMTTQFGIYYPLFIIDKNNTPCHIFIVFIFGQLAYYINLTENVAVVIICFILILFFSLVFNEIIEINILGFSKNTKKNIIKRGENDVGQSKIEQKDSIVENQNNDDIVELDSISSHTQLS